MTAIALQHRDTILERIRSGEITRSIGASLGVSGQAIRKALGGDPEYLDAQRDQAESMVEDAKEAVWESDEQVAIARARAMGDFAFRYAEAVKPEKYGRKGPTINLQVNVAGADQLLAGSAVAMLAEIMPAGEQIPQCGKGENAE